MIGVLVFSILIAFVNCRPSDTTVSPKNVVTVPPNCPVGQQWVNGECREVWRHGVSVANVVTVPPNCPPGQEYINGQCREVWRNVVVPSNCLVGQEWVNGACREVWLRGVSVANVITVPPNCPPGQEYVNGQCREVWIRLSAQNAFENVVEPVEDPETAGKNVISVPSQCPIGYKPDALGICREIFLI